jgi:hypothetical protein
LFRQKLLQFQDFVSDGNITQAIEFFMDPYAIETRRGSDEKKTEKNDYSLAVGETLLKQL